MQNSVLTSLILPISLAIIMFGMGLHLKIDDFKRVFKYPKSTFIGIVNQLLFLPIIAFLLAICFQLEQDMAIGFMLLSACPGGPTSSLITHICKGDVSLSISLTAINSLITVFTIPFIISFAMWYFANNTSTQVTLPILETIKKIILITIGPVSIGMLINYLNPKFSRKIDLLMKIISIGIFIAVIIGIIIANKNIILTHMKNLGPLTLSLNLITLIFGFYSSKLFRLNFKESITISIESGIQNSTVAIVIASSILKNSNLGIPAAVYALLMFFSGGLLMLFFNKKQKRDL